MQTVQISGNQIIFQKAPVGEVGINLDQAIIEARNRIAESARLRAKDST